MLNFELQYFEKLIYFNYSKRFCCKAFHCNSYKIFTEILEIEPSPNNGTNNLLSPFLKDYKYPLSKVQASLIADQCPFPDDFAERERIRNGSDCAPSSSCVCTKSMLVWLFIYYLFIDSWHVL